MSSNLTISLVSTPILKNYFDLYFQVLFTLTDRVALF